jgi:hypothetical protein
MTELELLERIAAGQTSYCRESNTPLEAIDQCLRRLAEAGYVTKVVRAVDSRQGFVLRLDVVGGLTLAGERRRADLMERKVEST